MSDSYTIFDGYRTLLKDNHIMAGLSEAALADVLAASTLRQVPRDGWLVRQGEPAAAFGILAMGRAKNMHISPEGHQTVIRYLKVGQEFGLVAVFEEFEYPISIQAVTDCAVLCWPGEALVHLMERHHRIAVNALRVMIVRNQERQRRYEELANEKVEQRLARSMLRLGQHLGSASEAGILIDIPISREDLAELIGTTLYTVSRTLSKWEQQGLVKSGRERVTIVGEKGLEAIADPQA